MEGKIIVWSEENQHYITIPDGDIASHKDIHDNFIPKAGVCELIRIMKNDVELNKRMDIKRTENENDVIYSCSRRTYDPELVVKALENLI